MKRTKRQDLPQGLWVLATPIGNLADLSSRTIQALAEADWIVCEDTRRTLQMLSALEIPDAPRLVRIDAHASERHIENIIQKLKDGENVALVTDAGTPAISDPGAELVRQAQGAGISVTPIPGPSAVTTLLSVAGFRTAAFVFRGFFPRKPLERIQELDLIQKTPLARVFVWFESPERIAEALQAISERFPDAYAVVGKELTKLHEKIFSGRAAQVAEEVRSEIESVGTLGEWSIALELAEVVKEEIATLEWENTLKCLINASISASEAAKQVSQHFGAPRNQVYKIAVELAEAKSAEKKR